MMKVYTVRVLKEICILVLTPNVNYYWSKYLEYVLSIYDNNRKKYLSTFLLKQLYYSSFAKRFVNIIFYDYKFGICLK